jgi:hypothetical protein
MKSPCILFAALTFSLLPLQTVIVDDELPPAFGGGVDEQDERQTPNHPNYGFWGSGAIILNLILVVFGLFTAGSIGAIAVISGFALLVSTLLFPIYFPPFKQVYQLISGVTGTLAVVLGWLLL